MKLKPLSPPSAADATEFDTRQMLLTVNRRMQKAVVASALATVVAAGSLLALMPLKRTVPYVLEVNKTTGEVVVPEQQPEATFRPAWQTKMFFVRRWVTDMLAINPYTFRTTDPRAQEFLRGSTAISEFRQFRAEDNTYQQTVDHPNLVRQVQITQVTPVAGTKNGAVAQVQTETMLGGQPISQQWLVTVYWTMIPPTTPNDVNHNPLGLWITDFKISKAATPSP
jgi:type IV secretory pathway component VirB8